MSNEKNSITDTKTDPQNENEISADYLTVFTKLNSSRCRTNNHSKADHNYIENCDYLKRIAIALKHYESFRKNKSKSITQFYQNLYTNIYSILNDHIHFISVHNYDIKSITKELELKYGIKPCEIDACDVISRHYRQKTKEGKSDDDGDEAENFLMDSLDRLHHHLFHIFHIGVRSNIAKGYSDADKEDDEDDHTIIDIEFKRLKQEIFTKRDTFLAKRNVRRLQNKNNKFNLILNQEDHQSDESDGLFEYIFKKGVVDDETIENIIYFMKNQQYDTDALKEDLMGNAHQQSSNVFCISHGNIDLISAITQFMHNIKLSETSFSTGQIFGYWEHWREATEKSDKVIHYMDHKTNIFNGYSKAELFVVPFYTDLKEEIFSSGFMNIEQWTQHLYKAQKYIQTVKVKNMKNKKKIFEKFIGIKWGESISLAHILCIILYCDTDDLQNNLSKSFRKRTAFESLSSLKKRHQKYAHFAKHIVEAVFIWGISGEGHDAERGPFYCGLSEVLNIGQFAVYLKGPTSTSRDIEVAINFATRNGCIMEIDNQTGHSYAQRMFDASWISNYSEENERLWVGYEAWMHRLRIKSITIIETNHNYKEFFAAVYIFDCILSGGAEMGLFGSMKIPHNTISMISSLIKNKLDKIDMNINEYISNCFNLYLSKKTKIMIESTDVYKYKIPHLFYEVHPTKERERKYFKVISVNKYYIEYASDSFNGLNLLNIKLFQTLFTNINFIKINVHDRHSGNERDYSFDLLSFLTLIQDQKTDVKYHLQSKRYSNKDSWLSLCLTPFVISSYKEKQWNIRYERTKTSSRHYDNIFIDKCAPFSLFP